MIVQEMSSYIHYNPELGREENQVTACGRLAYAEGSGVVEVGWTNAESEATCPLCIAAIERRDRRVYDE